MSSESTGASNVGRCLFCNLGCRLQLEQYAPQRWRPVYEGNNNGKLCARGQIMADLIHSPARLYRPQSRDGQYLLSETIQSLASRIQVNRGLKKLTIWLNGNVALEDLAVARNLCEQLGEAAELLVHMPMHEMGSVEGLDAAGVPQASPDDWLTADAVLVVGNPLVTHPPIAPCLMRWGRARHDKPMVVVDSFAGITGNFASDHLICRPGYEYWVVASILAVAGIKDSLGVMPGNDIIQEVMSGSGIGPSLIDQAADKLKSAKRPAVIIAGQSGGTERWRALTALAANWAKQQGGMVTVLTGCANALGVSRYMRRHDIQAWSSAMNNNQVNETNVLLIVGWDPFSAYPESMWKRSLEHAGCVALASAFRPASMNRVDELLPLAMGSETGGSYVLANGEMQTIEALMMPPSGVPTVRELCTELGRKCDIRLNGFHVSQDEISPSSKSISIKIPPSPSREVPGGWPAVMRADPTQYFDGQMTRNARWSQASDLLPELWLSSEDAGFMGLTNGQITEIKNTQGKAKIRIVVAHDQPKFGGCFAEIANTAQASGWMAVNGSYSEIRKLASWQTDREDESKESGTIYIDQVCSSACTDVQQEVIHANH